MNMRIPGTVPSGTELLVFLDAEIAKRQARERAAARDRDRDRDRRSDRARTRARHRAGASGYKGGVPESTLIVPRHLASCRPPRSGPTVASDRTPGLLPTIGSPYFALAVLFSMNLLNYIDRYVVLRRRARRSRRSWRFDDAEFGVLSVSFMIVYTIVSPLMGWLGDRYNRRRLLAFGVGALERGDGRDGVLASASPTCSSGGPCSGSARRATGSSPRRCWPTCSRRSTGAG